MTQLVYCVSPAAEAISGLSGYGSDELSGSHRLEIREKPFTGLT
jgi:hypothetical protein